MDLNKIKERLIWRHYGLSDERGVRLYCELIVYLFQRCRCPRCHSHLSEERIVDMMEHWPGSGTGLKERYFLFRMIGAIMEDNMGMRFCMNPPWDIGMGAEYCIQLSMKHYHEVMAQMAAEIQQCNPHQN